MTKELTQQITYSGPDTRAVISLPGSERSQYIEVDNLFSFSVSTFRDKSAVRRLNKAAPVGFVRGTKTYAGTFVFIEFTQRALYNLVKSTMEEGYDYQMDDDDLPAFDMFVMFVQETGNFRFKSGASRLVDPNDPDFVPSDLRDKYANHITGYQNALTENSNFKYINNIANTEISCLEIHNIEIVNSGIVRGVNEQQTENTMQFKCLKYTPIYTLSDKHGERPNSIYDYPPHGEDIPDMGNFT